MAHSCPDCGSACYCGGDIDILFDDDSDEAVGCTCCTHDDMPYEDDWDDFGPIETAAGPEVLG